MFVRLDHVGIVAHTIDEAAEVLVERLGLAFDLERSRWPEGGLYAGQNTRNFFVTVGAGETQIEILIPQDTTSGVAKYLAKRGAGLHHLGYAVESVEEDSRILRERGLTQIELPGAGAAFFYPKGTLGILTELVPTRPVRSA